MFEKLKKRWKIESNFQLAIILIVFSITGSSMMFVREPAFNILGVTPDTAFWIKALLYVAIVFPSYQIALLFFGTIFGQFRFFWEFEKKMLRRMRIIK